MRIIVESINIIDYIENKSKKVYFSKGLNVVTSGATSRGKSSVLRAVYHAMGANSDYDNPFEANKKIFEIGFYSDLNNKKYRIIRHGYNYLVFIDNNFSQKIESDYKKLASFFENEFNVSVYLTDKKNNFEIAPTTYLFIPYFLDQDRSWKNEIIPFRNFQQFAGNKLIDLYYYHLGALDTNFFELTTNARLSKRRYSELKAKKDKNYIEMKLLREKYSVENISIDDESAKNTLHIMKNEINEALLDVKTIQRDIFNLENDIVKNEISLKSIDEILKEQNKELKNERIRKEEYIVYCQNCGEEVDLSNFSEHSLKYNIEFLNEKRNMLEEETKIITEEIEKFKYIYNERTKNVEEMTKKYNDFSGLFDKFIRAKAVDVVMNDLNDMIRDTNLELLDIEDKIEQYESSLKEYATKKREINKDFREFYIEELRTLEVVGVKKSDIRNFKKYVLSGSQYVRSTLAFFVSFIRLKNKYNVDNYNFPLIIDSPFEGDQDGDNRSEIIKTILNIETKNQMIVALRDADEYFEEKDNVNIVKLKSEKGALLTTDDYIKNKEHNESVIGLVFDLKFN